MGGDATGGGGAGSSRIVNCRMAECRFVVTSACRIVTASKCHHVTFPYNL